MIDKLRRLFNVYPNTREAIRADNLRQITAANPARRPLGVTGAAEIALLRRHRDVT